MGGAESRLKLKTRFSELYSRPDILESDGIWQSLLSNNVDSPQVLFSFISAGEIRRLRDSHPENFETLITVVLKNLLQLTNASAMGHSSEPQLQSNIRVLTRLIPFLYESKSADHHMWLTRFFWSPHDDGVSLGGKTIEVLAGLLQYPGFTVPLSVSGIWTAGIGSPSSLQSTKSHISNRIEVLRLLLAILSEPLYRPEQHGLDIFVSDLSPQTVMYILSSLLNTALAYNQPIWNRPFEEGFVPDPNYQLAKMCLETLGLAIAHLPQEKAKINRFRMLISKIHRPQDISFLMERLTAKLEDMAPPVELVSFLWELIRANPKFRVAATEDSISSSAICRHLVRHIKTNRFDATQENSVRVMTYTLLTLSMSPEWASQYASTELLSIFQPFSQIDLHLPVLLDALYNVSDHLQFTAETSKIFTSFVDSLQLSSSHSEKGGPLIESVLRTVRIALATFPEENKTLVVELAKSGLAPKLQSKWLIELVAAVPATGELQSGPFVLPPIALTADKSLIQFTWDDKSLRWYGSVLWGRIYQTEMDRPGVGVWSSTAITLFKVETSVQVPSLRRPKGAVDAVADLLVNTFLGSRNRS